MDDKGEGGGRNKVVRPFAFTKDPLVQGLLNKFAERSEKGIRKFNNTMVTSTKPTAKWIDDAIEELWDAIVYLKKVRDIISSKKEEK